MADSLFGDSASPPASNGADLAVPTPQPQRGHKAQPSVGNAASLFGGDGDDPFASIASNASPSNPAPAPLAGLEEVEEEAATLFGGSSEPTAAVGDLFGAPATPAKKNTLESSLQVPPTTGSSGPASPGGLFAGSDYNDDWLGGGGQDAAADATQQPAASADQDLDWLSNDLQQASIQDGQTAYGEQPVPDQQHQYHYSQGYDAAAAGQGYNDQAYDGQAYDAPAQAGQQHDYPAYHEQSAYDQQGQYDSTQGYRSQDYSNQYQYDYSQQQPQAQQADQQHQYDNAPGFEPNQQYDYGTQQPAYDPYSQQQQYPSQQDQAQIQEQQAYGAYDGAAYGEQGDDFYGQSTTTTQQTPAAYDPYAARSSYDALAQPEHSQEIAGYKEQSEQPSWQNQDEYAAYGYDAQQPAVVEPFGDEPQQQQEYQPYDSYVPINGLTSPPPAVRAPSPYDPMPAPPTIATARAPSPYDPVPPPPVAEAAALSPPPPSHRSSLTPPPPPKGPPRGSSRSPRPLSAAGQSPPTSGAESAPIAQSLYKEQAEELYPSTAPEGTAAEEPFTHMEETVQGDEAYDQVDETPIAENGAWPNSNDNWAAGADGAYQTEPGYDGENGYQGGAGWIEQLEEDVKTPSATGPRKPWSPNSYDPYAPEATQQQFVNDSGLERNATVTQRNSRQGGHSQSGSGYSVPPPVMASTEENSYGSATTYAEPEQYQSRGQPGTPGEAASAAPDSNSYFDAGAQYATSQASFQRGMAPPSPYDPSVVARSYTSDASHSRSASGSAPDMVELMRNAKVPIASFGIGGKLATYFPTASLSGSSETDQTYGGYGYGATANVPTTVMLHSLSSLVPSSSYSSAFNPLQFPGPAFEGSAASANAISRATGAGNAGVKAKKTAIIKHLDERIQEISAGVGYLRRQPSFSGTSNVKESDPAASSSLECQRVEDKVLLLKLLKLLLEHDGQTTSNPAFDAAVRELLVGAKESSTANGTGTAPGFDMSSLGNDPSESSGEIMRSYELRSGFLKKVQAMLLRGERREAAELAVKEKMWAHAMTIASCVDKDCWRSVIADFIQYELGEEAGELQTLKVAYNLFSGQDPASVFDLFRPKAQLAAAGLQPEPATPAAASALPDWKGSAAIVLSNKSPGDSAALTAIGDGLATRGLIEAADFCYILAPQTSPFGGIDSPAVRMTLLGAANPKTSSSFLRDLDSIILTEILEFSQSLVPTVKSQEPYGGIPHLQAYRLVHAYQLAELGDMQKAQKYCEAIACTLKLSKNSPYLHRTLLSQLKELSDRLIGAPQIGAGGNWMTRKMQRPTLDGVWGALEGRFTKFIAGEDGAPDSDSPVKFKGTASGKNGPVGPFSHYTAITPDAASGGMSRQQSYADFDQQASIPTSRAGSAMDFHHTRRAPSPGKNRASSAMGIRQSLRDPYSEWPQPMSQLRPESAMGSSRASGSFEATRNGCLMQSSEFSTASSVYGADGSYRSSGPTDNAPWYGQDSGPASQRGSSDVQDRSGSQGYPGYDDYSQEGQSTGADDAPYYGAQQPQFMHNAEGPTLESAEDGEGFVSPMDAFSGSLRTPQPQENYSSNHRDDYDDEDEEDLGFGNSSSKKKSTASQSGVASSYEPSSNVADQGDEKPKEKRPASSSWLGRLWGGRSASTPGEQPKAKKAHLGEETAFYYDKDLKRWVNKTGEDSGSASPTPPPPPQRAQTTSPAIQPDRGAGALSTPPMRRASGDSLRGPPPRSTGFAGRATPPISELADEGSSGLAPRGTVPRARSNLADHSMPAASQPPMRPGSTTPLGDSGMPPPPPKTGTVKKRPIKSRYVVVD